MSLFLLAKLMPGNLRRGTNRRELSSETGCPAGLYAPHQESSMTSSNAVSTTTACQAVGSGYYSPAQDVDRYPCPQGSVAWNTDSAACTTCPAGTHAPLVASAVCTPCPRGSFTADTVVNVGDDPNALRIQCTVCNPLFYNGTGSDHALWLTPEDSTTLAVVIPHAGYYCLEPIATTEETPDDDNNNNNNEFGDSSSTTNPPPTMVPLLDSSTVPSASPTLAFTTTATTTPPPTTTGSIESKSKNHPAVKEALVGNDKMGWLAVVILIVGSVALILIVALVAWRGGWCGATKAGMDDTKPKGLSSSSDKNDPAQEEDEEDSLEPGKEEATTTSTTMDSTASASSASARTSHKWWSHKGGSSSQSATKSHVKATTATTSTKSLPTKKDGPPHNAFGTQEEFPEPQWPTPEDLFGVTTNTPPTNNNTNTGTADASSTAPPPPIATIAVVHHHKDESRSKSYDYSNIL